MPDNQQDGFVFQRAIAESGAKLGRKTHLAVFDFDSTLFRSPLPSADLWAADLRGCVISDCAWFLEPRTLAAPYIPEVPDVSWWDERVVERVRKLRTADDRDQNLVIVLTGRRRDLFYNRIEQLCRGLEQKLGIGYLFDIILLKEHQNEDGSKKFETTLDFKLSVLSSLLATFPDIQSIEIWDDRQRHLDLFAKTLNNLKSNKRIGDFTAELVLQDPLLMKTIPEKLEHEMVMELIGKCNARILAAEERDLAEEAEKKLNLKSVSAPNLTNEPLNVSPSQNHPSGNFPMPTSPLDSVLPGITPVDPFPPHHIPWAPTSSSLSFVSSNASPNSPPTSPKPVKSVTIVSQESSSPKLPKSSRRLTKNSSTPRKSISSFRSIIHVTEYVQYTGIFLSNESRIALLKRIPIPEAGKYSVKAHHITICLGQAPPELIDPLGGLGSTVSLRAVAVGSTSSADAASKGVVAVRVELTAVAGKQVDANKEECPIQISTNKVPHCTIYVGIGSRARDSNLIPEWIDLDPPIRLEGIISEKKVTGKKGNTPAPQKPADVSVGGLVKKYHSHLKGKEIGEVVERVQEWMAKTHMDNTSHNAPEIELYVANLKLAE
ncbi:hypothetical protein BJ741DRAFT_621104 [Chytriomyces cf. hyalinus JEL632]|nr:hypothetical protein BJ741DRAFT_621104 [Chytriomyces cf. hyalinus JEL632]